MSKTLTPGTVLCGFLCQIPSIQLIILALLLDELVMGAPLDDAALLHDHDAVGVAHRGQAVGDDKGGAPGHQGVHAVLHQPLGAGIDGGGGLVQNEHGRLSTCA